MRRASIFTPPAPMPLASRLTTVEERHDCGQVSASGRRTRPRNVLFSGPTRNDPRCSAPAPKEWAASYFSPEPVQIVFLDSSGRHWTRKRRASSPPMRAAPTPETCSQGTREAQTCS